jgi:hypothetical protein
MVVTWTKEFINGMPSLGPASEIQLDSHKLSSKGLPISYLSWTELWDVWKSSFILWQTKLVVIPPNNNIFRKYP